MIVKCPNPECRTTFDIPPEKLARNPNCKRCGTPFQLEEVAPAQPAPAQAVPAAQAGPGIGATMGPALHALGEQAMRYAPMVKERFTLVQRMADNATWALAIGLFLVVCATLFPQLDRAKVARREALIVVGDVREKRLDEEHAKKEKSTEEDEKRKKAKERWAKEKSSLEEDLEDAELAKRRWPYWYRWGMLLGLALMGAGALAYIRPSETSVRRILGAIVLATIILSFVGGGVRIDVGG
jgi:hypothetical protein